MWIDIQTYCIKTNSNVLFCYGQSYPSGMARRFDKTFDRSTRSVDSIRYPAVAYKLLARTHLNATSVEKITNTMEVVEMLSKPPIPMQQEEKRETNRPPISLLLLDCIRLFFKRWPSRPCRREDMQEDWRSSERPNPPILNHYQCAQGRNRTLSRSSRQSNPATRGEMRRSPWTTTRVTMDDW